LVSLKAIHNIARQHDKFNKNIPLKILVFTIFSLLFVLLYNQGRDYQDAIKNGFFIAPLITLMITHQEKYLNIFLKVYKISSSTSSDYNKEDDEIDEKSKKIRLNLLKIRFNSENYTAENKEIWHVIKETWEYSTRNRDSYKRENTQTLIIVAFLLMTGYIMLILSLYSIALFFLVYSFSMLVNRLFLALRAIIKYYLIAKVSVLLNNEVEQSLEKDMKNSMPPKKR